MDSRCKDVQKTLVELSGEQLLLSEEQQRHVTGCSECAKLAEAERGLHSIFAQAVVPADAKVEQAVLEAVTAVRSRRRAFALLPVAASLLVAMAGVLLMGGVPGSGLLSLLPAWSTEAWLALVQTVADWSVVLVTTAWALSSELPILLPITAGLIATAGLAFVASAVYRQRNIRVWQSNV